MKAVAIRLTILVVGLAVLAAGCTKSDLLAGMADLDRAYIPALALTSQGSPAMAQKAVRVLVESWQTFKARYARGMADDPEWRADLAFLDARIAEAVAIAAVGANLVEAHEALERVRLRLLETRQQRLGLDYYVDYLTVFHGPMEEIYLAAKGKTPATLTDVDIAKIAGELPEAWTAWGQVERARFDNSIFRLSDQKLAERRQYLKAGADTLTAVEVALRRNDRAGLIQAATQLRTNFVKLFLLFGDFDALK